MSTSTTNSQDSLVITQHQFVYYNPIILAMPFLSKKMNGMEYIIRRIGLYTSRSKEIDRSIRVIQDWWLIRYEKLVQYWQQQNLELSNRIEHLESEIERYWENRLSNMEQDMRIAENLLMF
ncbi:MAG: hypothetical protein GY861_06160 [bacterium]|nr:hypothetical protein [bacterium]